MKKIFVLVTVCFTAFFSIPFAFAKADIVRNSTLYAIKDFYEVNWHRDYWDEGSSAIDGAAGDVTYTERGDAMTVHYTGVYETGDKNNIMWGVTGQLGKDKRDFSQGEYFASEVKNEQSTEAKYQLIVSSDETDGGSFYPMDGEKYYLLGKDGTVSEGIISAAFFSVPSGFDGTLLVPMQSYSNRLDKTNVLRFSLGFPRNEEGTLTFGRQGWVDNGACLQGGALIVHDETIYFDLPEKIVLEPAPYRPVTEPETAMENRVA